MTDDRFVSYAQNLEDVMLWRALGQEARPGFYIDVGAAHPTALSVTRAFYDRGWRGIDVEPLPEQAALLRRARPRDVVVQAALAETAGTRTFHRVSVDRQTGLSALDAAAAGHAGSGAAVDDLQVEVTTLAAICGEHVRGPVHFLKIDVEGAEAAVLAGADFAACRPWIIVVEAKPPHGPPAWANDLVAAGYHEVWFDGLNRFYVADEQARLDRHFAAPANVFDRYTVHDAPLADAMAATEALAATREAAIRTLEAEVARLRDQRALDPAAWALPPPAPSPPPSARSAPPPPPRPALRRFAGRALRLLYGLVRPVARPLAWRGRQFLIGPILQELDGHRIRLDQLIARPTIHPQPQAGAGVDPAMVAAMNRLLLTLALEDGRRPWPDAPLPNPDARS